MTPEQKYILSTSYEHRKKFAQFFTPEDIAKFMCGWVMQGKCKTRILEPAYGLGVFSRILSRFDNISIDAYEIDSYIFKQALPVLPPAVNLRNRDYFSSDWKEKYDAIICNPPYLKFHDYSNSAYVADVNKHVDIKLNGFANIYTLFLLKSLTQLQDGGRLAYIVPSEFLNSDYGVAVKKALLMSGSLKHVIVIDFNENTFEGALTTSCILLCEKCDNACNVKFSLVRDIDNLDSCFDNFSEFEPDKLDAEIKWKSYYEGSNSKKYKHLVPFSNFAKVSRGIATGANDYFTFNLSKIYKYNLPLKCFHRCICHSADVDKLVFVDADFEALSAKDKAVYLFDGKIDSNELNVADYLRRGESSGINKKYLTASRNPWFALENRPPAHIWVSVFNRKGLKFIRNKSGAYNLTTFHCIYNRGVVDTDLLFAYLVTDVAKEILLDNSRQYGNGLIKFEPNDLNKGMVVDLRLLSVQERGFVIDAARKLQTNESIRNQVIAILDYLFRKKFTVGKVELSLLRHKLARIASNSNFIPSDFWHSR